MVSIPRDLVDVPLGNGDTFGPKINSLLGWANRHEDDFPQGGTRALEDAIGALLGVPIHYYAKVDLAGFVTMVDAVGGVDIDVARPLSDPNYGGFGVGPGWSITRRAAPPRRRQRAGLRADPQVDRRERLHPRRPPAGGPHRAPRPGRRGRQLPLQPAGPPRRGRRHGPDGPAGGSPAGARGPRRGDRRRADDPGRDDVADGQVGRQEPPVRLGRHPRPEADRGDGRDRVHGARNAARPVAAPRSRPRRRHPSSEAVAGSVSSAARRPPRREALEQPIEVVVDEEQVPVALARRSPRARRGRGRRRAGRRSRRRRARRPAWRGAPSWAHDRTSASSSSVPRPPGRARNASDSSAMTAFRSWSVVDDPELRDARGGPARDRRGPPG